VVEDEMDVERPRHVGVEDIEEFPKLDRSVPAMPLVNHLAHREVERGKERGRAVPHVVVRAALQLAWAHRKQGLRAVERVDLGTRVHAEDPG
jgi:hypothetical protein